MTNANRQAAEQWVNDYLDLYNYAVRIGDAEWQQEIVRTLGSKEAHIRELSEHLVLRGLWLRFDAINRKMIELYEQLRDNRDAVDGERLREKVWELKRQRVIVANEIRAHRP
ncbi:hypothetical protein [Cohnella xylanilytica]|nr:hypothetical protein [Cohnella xylanilytica]